MEVLLNNCGERMVTNDSSPAEKVTLFRALFRGREDVYARRWENPKTGKSGYSPCCAVEWVRGVCGNASGKANCATCPMRQFRALDDAAIEAHLRGVDVAGKPFALGCYPLLTDDTVRFAAIDFDKSSWRADSATIMRLAGPNPNMEVDLLCTTRKIAIEVDGKLHFAAPENYRRDRRKDYLLQKHGYTVLRFLAEDVLERIDDVMNVINDCVEDSANQLS